MFIGKVVFNQKQMGSRAVFLILRSDKPLGAIEFDASGSPASYFHLRRAESLWLCLPIQIRRKNE
jgi:hypothetical protein